LKQNRKSKGGNMKKFLIGIGVFVVFVFVFDYFYTHGSKSKEPEQKAEQFIKYSVLRQWKIGSTGIGMEILVSPTNTKDEIMALAGNLRKEKLRGGPLNIIFIFDSKEAWANRDNDAYPEKTYWKHFLVEINTQEAEEIKWVAEGREEPQKKQ